MREMTRQRGLAMIAIYALLALGGIVALVGWWEVHNYQIRAAERAKWTEKLKACEAATTTAVEANKSLQASSEALIAKLKAQNEQIAKLHEAEAAARKTRDAALEAALTRERLLRTKINQLMVIANAPAVPTTVEVCNEAGDILRSLVSDRLQ